MAETQERDELHRLVDELPEDAVRSALQVVRALGAEESPRPRPPWIGAGHLGPDFASRAKDVLATIDRRHFSVVRPDHCTAFTLLP